MLKKLNYNTNFCRKKFSKKLSKVIITLSLIINHLTNEFISSTFLCWLVETFAILVDLWNLKIDSFCYILFCDATDHKNELSQMLSSTFHLEKETLQLLTFKSKAHVTHNIFAHNIGIKRFCNKKYFWAMDVYRPR